MTLDYSKHKNILLQILKDIYSDTSIAPFLGFKGGTAALLFYDLGRGSADLDFDLLDESKEQIVFDTIKHIVTPYGNIVDSRIKRFNLLYVLSYDTKAQNIKVEVNRRHFGSMYEMKTLFGISMLVMVRADMFAHKLMAMHERMGKTSRDIYDVWFFLQSNWPINKSLVEKRTGLTFKESLTRCIKKLENVASRSILSGMGELLDPKQKAWAKAKLKTETLFLLKVMLESEQ